MTLQYVKRGTVGYTIIGHPTIENRIASGFSETDYLRINQNVPTKMEGLFTFTTGADITSVQTIFSFALAFAVEIGEGVIRSYNWGNNHNETIVPHEDLAAHTTYAIKINRNTSHYSACYSKNGGAFSVPVTWTNTRNQNSTSTIGLSPNHLNQYMRGTVDLNHTYIKDETGTRWFGEQKDTLQTVTINSTHSANYLIKDGKLMWADSRVFLRSTGSQYINTGIKATQETRVLFKAANESTSEAFFYGARTSYGSYDKHCWNIHTESYYPQFCHHSHAYSYTYVTGTPQVIGNGKNGGYINGTQQVTYEYEKFSCPYNLYLFGLNESNSLEYRTLHGKIYYFKIYEGNTLVRHFVPVPTGLQIGNFTVPNNGMFDLVNQQFYANAGTGNFTWSKDQ